MMRNLLPSLVVVLALVFILMTLQADADDAELKHDKEPKGQLILNQTAFGRKASAGGKDAEEAGENKKSSQSGYMTDSDNGGSDDNNAALHLNSHHYFTDPRKLPPRN